jgi:hypothetical protein
LWTDAKARRLTHHAVQKLRPFEPPMAKEFGIVRGHDHRRPSESCTGLSELVLPLRQEMGRMLPNRLQGLGAIVEPLVCATTGDSMVLESAGVANPGSGEKLRHGFPLRLIG